MPIGCPYMTRGRTLEKSFEAFGISMEFEEWTALAKNGK